MFKVKCIEVDYQEGEFHLVSGVKQDTESSYGQFGSFQSRGHGWGQYTSKSDIALTVESDEFEDGLAQLSLGEFFKDEWGRLSRERQVAIINTMPEIVQVENDPYFSSFSDPYVVVEKDLKSWLERAKKDHKRAAAFRRKIRGK